MSTDPYPDNSNLRTGDLLFPRHPDAKSLPTSLGWADLLRAVEAMLSDAFDRLSDSALTGDLGERIDAMRHWNRTFLDNTIPANFGPQGLSMPAGGPNTRAGSASLARLEVLRHLGQQGLDVLLGDLIQLARTRRHSPGAGSAGRGDDGDDWLVQAGFGRLAQVFSNLPGTGKPTVFGYYVGHVGIVERDDDDRLWVVESSYRADGMQMTPYDDWRAYRESIGAHVWHGRVIPRNRPPLEDRQIRQFVDHAHLQRMLGKRYAIFDRDARGKWTALGDETYVYCSELVWLCGKAIGIDLDTRGGLKLPWLGPQALTTSAHVRMLHQPGGERY